VSETKNFDGAASRARIGAAADTVKNIQQQLQQADADLLSELNARIAEVSSALFHIKEIAALLTATRSMQQGR
jgi:hypothetical protein